MTQPPVVCRPKAYWLFAQQLPRLATTEGLWKAAAALAMHADEHIELEAIDRRFESLAARVRSGARSGRPLAVLTHLHHVLFDQEGFCGNFDDYYLPANSYLPTVLDTRRGLPILLSLIYKVVGERVGLKIEGINAPNHFLARTLVDDKWLIIDPFFHGQLLTTAEAVARLSTMSNEELGTLERYLPAATHQQWISRVLNNLRAVFAAEGRANDVAAMLELQRLLWASG